MPQRRQPASLYDIAKENVFKLLISLTDNIFKEHRMDLYEAYEGTLKEVARYIEFPVSIREDLMEHLWTLELEEPIRFCLFKLLFNDGVTSMMELKFDRKYGLKSLVLIRDLGKNLKMLSLDEIHLEDEDMDLLPDLLKKLPNLEELFLPLVNDRVLAAVRQHLPRLLKFYVRDASNISAGGLCMLYAKSSTYEASRLKILHLREFNVTSSDVTMLLKNLPDLISLGEYQFVGKALELFISDNSGETTKLQHLRDTGTSQEILSAIVKLCPNLSSIRLESPSSGVIQRLHLIPELKKVALRLFNSGELVSFLSEGGERLIDLDLSRGVGDVFNLTSISSSCPNLQIFKCYFGEIVAYGEITFFNLKWCDISFSKVYHGCVKSLLINSPKLEYLEVFTTDADTSCVFSDNDIYDIIQISAPQELDTLVLAGIADVTELAFRDFISACPKLRFLGNLEDLGISSDQIKELKSYVKLSNFDLNFV